MKKEILNSDSDEANQTTEQKMHVLKDIRAYYLKLSLAP